MVRALASFISNCSSARRGYILIIISSLLASLAHVIAKPLLDNGSGIEIHPVSMAICIYVINAIFFTPFTKKSIPVAKVGSKNLALLAIIGVSEVVALVTYFSGLKDSTATNASIFVNGEIIFSLLIAIVAFKESLKNREKLPFVMLILGMMVLPVSYDIYANGMAITKLVFGDALIILSGMFYALNVTLCKFLSSNLDIKRIMQLVYSVSAACAIGAMFVFNVKFDISSENLVPLTIFAIGGTGISAMLFVISLRLLGSVRTILLFSTNSVFGVIFSNLILSEAITPINIISAILTFGGVYMLRNKLGDEHGEKSITLSESDHGKKQFIFST